MTLFIAHAGEELRPPHQIPPRGVLALPILPPALGTFGFSIRKNI